LLRTDKLIWYRFRWAVCQLDTLRKCVKPSAIKQALRELPKTLDETYDRILNGIPDEFRQDAQGVMRLLAFSARPLSLQEVAEAVAVDVDNECFDPENRLPDPFVVLEICSSLVVPTVWETWEGQLTILQFAHYSVKEYLVSTRILKSPAADFRISERLAHKFIAEVCLSYILSLDKPDVFTLFTFESYDGPQLNDGYKKMSFLSYAAKYWPHHSQALSTDVNSTTLPTLVWRLFDSTHSSSFFNWIAIYRDELVEESGPPRDISQANRLYYSSLLGLYDITKWLLEHGADVDGTLVSMCTPLQAAAGGGHEAIARLLIEKGANVNATGGFHGSALQAAAYRRHEAIVQLLLEKGANVNATGGFYGSALKAAIVAAIIGADQLWFRGTELAVLRLLLANGADVNATDGKFCIAFRLARAGAARGASVSKAVVQLLLEYGAVDDSAEN
jgi:hypothetical protein